MSPPRRRSFAHKVVVVTGASAGLGRSIADAFATEGANVALLARDGEALEELEAELRRRGGQAIGLACDVSDATAIAEAAERIEAELGPIDVWVNDAMTSVFAPIAETTPEEFRRVTEVTYLGYVYGTMAAVKHMRRRGYGVVVQVGSSLSYRGIPLQSAYCGAKHAIRGFTDSLRSELIHERINIRLVMVQLPAMNTPQFDWARTHMAHQPRPVAPVIQPEVAARAIVAAARGSSREVWLGVSTAKVILASMLAPGLLDRLLARSAFEAQERPTAVQPDRHDNLLQPVHQLHRAHGSFDAEAGRYAVALPGEAVRAAAGFLAVAGSLMVGLGAANWIAARSRRR
jgi:NAD(P)-dependent dehydrogenase (short-subunit alcohol dehydrogenase family)